VGPAQLVPELSALAVDGGVLQVVRWPARTGVASPSVPAPPVVLVHGYAEHSGRYGELASALARTGSDVWAADLRGHGRSSGRRADVVDLDLVLDDLDRLVDLVKRAAPLGTPEGPAGWPPVLVGHSMGGAFAAAYASSRPGKARALVLSAPAVHLALRPAWQTGPAQLIARHAPWVRVGRVPAHRLSSDPATVERFEKDPLVWHGLVPVRTAVAMLEAGRRAFAGAGSLHVPVLLLHGEQDEVVPLASSRKLFEALGSDDKELAVLAASRHEALHDGARAELVERVCDWVSRH
jgi:alpha-beta hydrolase superfamily lysophospholipase